MRTESFRENVPRALDISLRSTPISRYTEYFRAFASFIAFSNFAFVSLLSSGVETPFLDNNRHSVAGIIVFLSIIEMLFRSNLTKLLFGVKVAPVNKTFDAISVIAVFVSLWGKYETEGQLNMLFNSS